MRVLVVFVLLSQVACSPENIGPSKMPPPSCIPDCAGLQCGSDGCGGSCGVCDVGRSCQGGICIDDSCRPSCAGYECGDDGCGGECGACRTGTCINHTCVNQEDDCETRTYTATTCAANDPCHWVNNGVCDDTCATSYAANHFDDTVDCTSAPCAGECAAGLDTACTCSAADPCGRVGDGTCDEGCAIYFPADHLVDSVDCAGAPCGGECDAEEYSACTCATADPCGWGSDGNCDNYCATNFPTDHFDDGNDCAGGPCDGECVAEQYTTCTCAVADPCGWIGDDFCDDYCEINFSGDFFDDSVDCNSCAQDCAEELWTECSCAADDPCGWAGDGFCDGWCATTFPEDHFDDSADCGDTCGTECTDLDYTACTCGVTDPCGWAGDTFCDDYCASNFTDYFDDGVDCQCYGDCELFYYTACTCSALDICGWVGDGYCDDDCRTDFPDDHFDDPADCN